MSPRFLIAALNMSDGNTKMRAVPNTAPLIEETNDKSVSFHAIAVVKARSAYVVWLRRDAVRFSSGIFKRSSVPSLVPTKRRG